MEFCEKLTCLTLLFLLFVFLNKCPDLIKGTNIKLLWKFSIKVLKIVKAIKRDIMNDFKENAVTVVTENVTFLSPKIWETVSYGMRQFDDNFIFDLRS